MSNVKLWLAKIALVAAYLCGVGQAIAQAQETILTDSPGGDDSPFRIVQQENPALEQVNSVSELSDVKPTD